MTVSTEWLVRQTDASWSDDSSSWQVTSGGVAFYHSTDFYGHRWRIDLEVFHPEGDGPSVVIGHQHYEFLFGSKARPHTTILTFKRTAAATGKHPFPRGKWITLSLEREDGRIAVSTSEGWNLCALDPAPNRLITDLMLELPPGTRFRNFSVVIGGKKGIDCRNASLRPLLRAVSIDFNDDVMPGPWSSETIDQQMRFYKESGIQRIYFLPPAMVGDGYWNMPNADHYRHFRETAEAIGDFLPAFAKAAKTHGLEFIGVCKLFDRAFEKDVVPFHSEDAKERGGFESLSGVISRRTNWLNDHPTLRLRRHPSDLQQTRNVREIKRLVLRSETGNLDANFTIWASEDNTHYEPLLVRSIRRSRNEQEFTLPGAPRWLAIVREPGSTERIGNRLQEWVRCYDAAGKEVPISFAVATKYGEFPNALFRFDANLTGRQPLLDRQSYWWMEEGTPLAIVSGYEPYMIGAPSPSWPAVRQDWLSEIARYFEWGCDGVDIRVANHNRTLDWERYGFDDPVLKEIGPDPSPEEVRACLGRHYSTFIAEASILAKSLGKQLHLHLEHGFRPAELPCDMNIAFEWEKWLGNGWADEVTLVTHSVTAGIMPQMRRMAHKLGIPANLRPYLSSMIRGPRARLHIERVLHEAREYRLDGLNLYENALFFEVDQNRHLKIKANSAEWWKRLTNPSSISH